MEHMAEVKHMAEVEVNECDCRIDPPSNLDITTDVDSKLSDRIFANIQKYSHEEYQYLNNIENILENGTWEVGRNGRTKSVFGSSMRFSLKDGKIPILTTKKTAWKTCLKELLWFIRGETDNKILKMADNLVDVLRMILVTVFFY